MFCATGEAVCHSDDRHSSAKQNTVSSVIGKSLAHYITLHSLCCTTVLHLRDWRMRPRGRLPHEGLHYTTLHSLHSITLLYSTCETFCAIGEACDSEANRPLADYITLHSLQCISLYSIPFHYTTLFHAIPLQYCISPARHSTPLARCVTARRVATWRITLQYIHYTALHYIPFDSITLHYFTPFHCNTVFHLRDILRHWRGV